MKPKVYLAGPITGLTYDESTDWREKVHRDLQPDIETLSPMRAKSYLKTLPADLIGDEYSDRILSTQKAITARDRWDTQRADLVIFNFLGAKVASIGTAIELGWADAARVPGILVIEKTGNIHDHSMVRETTGWRVDTLEDAVATARAILMPDRLQRSPQEVANARSEVAYIVARQLKAEGFDLNAPGILEGSRARELWRTYMGEGPQL